MARGKRIERLAPEQEARFAEYVERWKAIGLCIDRADRSKAEAGVREAYRIGGREPPERVVWCGSPMGQALTFAIVCELLKRGTNAGDSVRNSVGDIWVSVRDSVRTSVGASVWTSVRDSVRDSVWDSVSTSVGASVRNSVEDSVWASVRDSIWDPVRTSVRDLVRDSIWDSSYGQHDAPWISFYAFFDEVVGLHSQTQRLDGIRAICESGGWWLPYEHICWISERHGTCKLDERELLHCEDGPAIVYPDGWAIYAWHGVRVPARVVEMPETLTVEDVRSEENAEVRRVMMGRFGTERFLRETGAELVAQDDYGKLWRTSEVAPDELEERPWAVLEVSCPSTARTYFLRVPPDVERAEQAWRWTLDVDDEAEVVAES